MIIDTHCHLNTIDTHFYFYEGQSLDSLLLGMSKGNVDKSIVCLNPKISELSCKNDCTHNCFIFGDNHNVELCPNGCPNEMIHRVKTFDSIPHNLTLKCLECGNVIYEGPDPTRKYNLKLLDQISAYPNKLYPMIYLHASNSTVCDEIDFYESNYKIYGYKFHPQTNYRSINELCVVPTQLPIMIHVGIGMFDHPRYALEFALKQPGKVILAHACRLDPESLTILGKSPNCYIDVCPSQSLYNFKNFAIVNSFKHLIHSPQDIYMKVLEYVSPSKIVFGADFPWGSQKEEVSIVESLPISKNDKDKILFKNAQEIFGIE